MRLKITLILTLFIKIGFGQYFYNDSIISLYVDKLIDNKIDTILIYENGCFGCDEPIFLMYPDTCIDLNQEPLVSYVIWRKNNIDYITKLSTYDCFYYTTIKYDFKKIWDFCVINEKTINQEKLLPPTYYNNHDTLQLFIDHHGYTSVKLYLKDRLLVYEINDFYLIKKIDDKFINLNFDKNINTYQIQLRDLIDKEIQKIDKLNLIEKKKNGLQHTI